MSSIFIFVAFAVSLSTHFSLTSASTANPAFITIGTFRGFDANESPYQKTFFVPKYFRVTWTEARSICKDYNYDIASFESFGETLAVQSMCASKSYLFDDYTHVGGITTVPASKDNWYWVNSGNKINYTLNWFHDEPNNWNNEEYYLSLRKPDFLFNDLHNYLKVKFLCEKREKIDAQDVAAGNGFEQLPSSVCDNCVVG